MLFSKSKSQLGVDIGTSNIKIVQLKPKDNKFVLETYGLVDVSYPIAKQDSDAAINHTASLLKNLIKKAGVTTNRVIASLPNSAVFTSVIEMPKIPEDELKAAIEFEAKKYVPLPLEEIALSWSLIEEKKTKASLSNYESNKYKVLLTAVPNSVIQNYLKVFRAADLEAEALEIEALALIRSLVAEDMNTILLIDIGAKNTSINLVDNGYLRLSKNLTLGGDTVTTSVAQSLSVNFSRAEQFKKDFGLSASNQQIPQVMRPILDIIKNEAMQLINLFESREERIDKILLSGGGAKLPHLADYFSVLGKPVILAQPWSRVIYPAQLKPIIEQLGLNLAVAAGLSMRQS
ncbi:MAG TPA: type IV pilus assembly protein PilM [Patescibacteria group bacterium]|jgi:type IV pilus assembly protein PilM|nr:type IV pilus assembly protein PilM [Patescibacteria group bacterium]